MWPQQGQARGGQRSNDWIPDHGDSGDLKHNFGGDTGVGALPGHQEAQAATTHIV